MVLVRLNRDKMVVESRPFFGVFVDSRWIGVSRCERVKGSREEFWPARARLFWARVGWVPAIFLVFAGGLVFHNGARKMVRPIFLQLCP